MHSTSTVYPGNIDPKLFFSDVSLRYARIHDTYNNMINDEDYVAASQYLYNNVESQNVDMDYNGAYLWNRFENMLLAIENYTMSMDSTNTRPYYQTTEPKNIPAKTVWIM
jgi:hypothetical protein